MKFMSISHLSGLRQASNSQLQGKFVRDWGLGTSESLNYMTKGFFVRRGCFSLNDVDWLLKSVKQGMASLRKDLVHAKTFSVDGKPYAQTERSTIQLEPGDPSLLRVVEPFSVYSRRFSSLLNDPRLVAPMFDITRSSIVSVFTDKFNFKSAFLGSAFDWHQDAPYWAHTGAPLNRLCNVLLALDNSTESNGCLRVYTGSHTAGILPGKGGEGQLSSLFTDPEGLDTESIEPIPMRAGDVLFFSPYLVHGSRANHSRQPRRALVATYQPGDGSRFHIGNPIL